MDGFMNAQLKPAFQPDIDTGEYYNKVQLGSDGYRYVLCKNCRVPVRIVEEKPPMLGALCSPTCRKENAEFYK